MWINVYVIITLIESHLGRLLFLIRNLQMKNYNQNLPWVLIYLISNNIQIFTLCWIELFSILSFIYYTKERRHILIGVWNSMLSVSFKLKLFLFTTASVKIIISFAFRLFGLNIGTCPSKHTYCTDVILMWISC